MQKLFAVCGESHIENPENAFLVVGIYSTQGAAYDAIERAARLRPEIEYWIEDHGLDVFCMAAA